MRGAVILTLLMLAGCSGREQPAVVIQQGLQVPDRLRSCPTPAPGTKAPPSSLPRLLTTDLLRQLAELGIAYAKAVRPTVRLCPPRLRGLNDWIGANTVGAGKSPIVVLQQEEEGEDDPD